MVWEMVLCKGLQQKKVQCSYLLDGVLDIESWCLVLGYLHRHSMQSTTCSTQRQVLEVGIKRLFIRRSGNIASVRKQETKKKKSVRNRATNSISNWYPGNKSYATPSHGILCATSYYCSTRVSWHHQGRQPPVACGWADSAFSVNQWIQTGG
jgi:hypothetical protein